MITFTLCLVLLIVGYFTYGKFVEHVFRPDDRPTPAFCSKDGVDYLPLPTWKVFMIQFLNIAGTGPIFGAILGAQFGTSSFLWIVFGSIFAGAVHDYFSGMLSMRQNGAILADIVGEQLGKRLKTFFGILVAVLLLLTTTVFVSAPANVLDGLTPSVSALGWIGIIFAYYVLATLLPIDKIIGRIYPLFAFALLFMVVGILCMLYIKQPAFPEIWEGFGTKFDPAPIFPVMFISIACGAISGFHGTQSPLMARCVVGEREGRKVFYGAMITEGIVALTWAAAAVVFYNENGVSYVDNSGKEVVYSAARVATFISQSWLGRLGGVLALLGVVVAPITSGDTSLRSARLSIASALHFPQKKISNRVIATILCSVPTIGLIYWSLQGADGFKLVWRYFAWTNQTMAMITLWAATIYLVKQKKWFLITLIPALFMTMVSATYISVSAEGFRLPYGIGLGIGAVAVVGSFLWFLLWYRKRNCEI